MPDEDLTFNVVWEVNTHTVTYMSGDVVFATFADVAYGTTPIPTPDNNPTKLGHHFVGWTPSVPATMPDSDKTFLASFEKNDYVVSLTATPTT